MKKESLESKSLTFSIVLYSTILGLAVLDKIKLTVFHTIVW